MARARAADWEGPVVPAAVASGDSASGSSSGIWDLRGWFMRTLPPKGAGGVPGLAPATGLGSGGATGTWRSWRWGRRRLRADRSRGELSLAPPPGAWSLPTSVAERRRHGAAGSVWVELEGVDRPRIFGGVRAIDVGGGTVWAQAMDCGVGCVERAASRIERANCRIPASSLDRCSRCHIWAHSLHQSVLRTAMLCTWFSRLSNLSLLLMHFSRPCCENGNSASRGWPLDSSCRDRISIWPSVLKPWTRTEEMMLHSAWHSSPRLNWVWTSASVLMPSEGAVLKGSPACTARACVLALACVALW
mmetsp:Transcript_7399/g.13071  ORF Transcript_7399/g.13071 Transcript_7399/m.13071 type:complete len:304 (-) Transcript_7399:439-1350(-)